MNAARYAEPLLPDVQEVSEQRKVYIFNVGPWPQERLLGSLGRYYIPACPDGEEYSAPLVLKGIIREHYPINENENKNLDDTGWNVAHQVIGVGPHLPPQASFVPYGVFLTRNEVPSKQELAKAKAALRETYLRNVAEADRAYSMGPKAAEETIRPETHFVSARALGKTEVDCLWLKNSAVPAERRECPSCNAPYKVGAVLCQVCHFVIDKKAYRPEDYAK